MKLRLRQIILVATLDAVRDADGKVVGTMSTPQGGPKPEDQPLIMFEAEVPDAVLEWLRGKGLKV